MATPSADQPTPIYLEVGKKWVFACAIDWPGWARRGKGEEAAIEALLEYADRYAAVVGPSFAPGELTVVGKVPGTATTDFGAPDVLGDWDAGPVGPATAGRLADLVDAAWQAFDAVVRTAPAELHKGPRGGGRDRDAVASHVQEAERQYASSLGAKLPPRTPWEEQRSAILDAIRSGRSGARWPVPYAARRIAWHVLDHAWEIQDKSS
jgi:hypothetical protein